MQEAEEEEEEEEGRRHGKETEPSPRGEEKSQPVINNHHNPQKIIKGIVENHSNLKKKYENLNMEVMYAHVIVYLCMQHRHVYASVYM